MIIGATGTIGSRLSRRLIAEGRSVIIFSRNPGLAADNIRGAAAYVEWRPERLSDEAFRHIGMADGVVYLAGAALFDGHPKSRAEVETESKTRTEGMRHVVKTMAAVPNGPRVFIAASSTGYYGYERDGGEAVEETTTAGNDWWGQDSRRMEEAALAAAVVGIRSVVVRTGYVLTKESLAAQTRRFRRHLGGWVGNGRAWIAWIHVADEVAAITFALDHPEVVGPVNLTAPEPVRARDFATAIGRVLNRRAWLAIPSPLVRLGLGDLADIVVKGKRVVPAKLLSFGFSFTYPALQPALFDLLGGRPA